MQHSDPVTSAALNAVSGCTRALAGTSTTDTAFDTIDALTVGGLRSLGDRAALRERHLDPRAHLQFRPAQIAAAAVYDALALARVDASSVRWLRGLARN